MSVLDSLMKENQSVKLPSLPVVGLKILELVKNDDFSVIELAGIISTDPALAARVLKMANSTLYKQVSEVDSIGRAISILGAKVLKNMALSFVIIKELGGDGPDLSHHERFWKQAVTAAVAAERLSRELNIRSDDTFIIALLMNIGKNVMFTYKRDEYLQVLDEQRISGDDIAKIEKRIFGFDHQEVSRDILKKWNIPEKIYAPIMFHHNMLNCPPEFQQSAKILGISSIVASIYNVDRSAEALESLYTLLKDQHGFIQKRVNKFIDDVAIKSIEVLDIYNIDPGDLRPYSELMEEANQELSNLGLSYEFQMMELKESKERSMRLAQELMDATARIKVLSGLLHVCKSCKKICDEGGLWRNMDEFIGENSEAKLEQCYCPDCESTRKLREELENNR